jgi:hypothetical protein
MAVGYVAGETDQERRQLGVVYRLAIFTGCWFSLPDMPRRKRRAKKQSEKPAKMAEEGEKKRLEGYSYQAPDYVPGEHPIGRDEGDLASRLGTTTAACARSRWRCLMRSRADSNCKPVTLKFVHSVRHHCRFDHLVTPVRPLTESHYVQRNAVYHRILPGRLGIKPD